MATKDKQEKQEKQDKQEGKSEKAGFASQVEALFLTFYEGRFQMFGWHKLGMRSVTSAKVRVPWTGSQYQSPYVVILQEAVQKVQTVSDLGSGAAYGFTEDWGKKFYKNQVQRLVARNVFYCRLCSKKQQFKLSVHAMY